MSRSDPTTKPKCSKPKKEETPSNLPFNLIILLDSLDETLAAAITLADPKLRGRKQRQAIMRFAQALGTFMQHLEDPTMLPLTQGAMLDVLNR